MEERKVPPGTSDGGTSGGGGESSSRPPSSYVKVGDRQMFNVELRPGETTIVSWKKLIKDANKASRSNSIPDPPVNVRPNLEACIAPGQPDEELKEASHPNRFSAVIEKIERLYMGKDSSDEEDLLDVPDDDQYDTEDSFIDDAELDEYFKVDNSEIKHDGFFVNRGKLERLNAQPQLPSQQPKKRRRKELVKNNGEDADGHGSNKHLKVSKPQASITSLLSAKNSFNSSQNLAILNEDHEESKSRDKSNISCSKKKYVEGKQILDTAVSPKVSNGAAAAPLVEVKDFDKQKVGVLQSKNINEKCEDAAGSLEVTHQKYHEKRSCMNSKSQHGRPLSVVIGLENSYSSKERNGKNRLPDLNLIDGKPTEQAIKSQYTQRKDGTRPKNSMLEKAIRELEKMVAESRPPTGENQEVDSPQAVKRRLPREIKLKLAKVARLAASHGKVSKELINRLMSILGHLMQLRTLKRNLKVMISMGLPAKEETKDRFQQVKKEVVEMIKVQAPSLESKAIQPLGGTCGDFQELGSDEKGSSKQKFCMDTALEDKICELYDLFVDGLNGDAAPQVRKLYAELAQLWPNNTMDNHGIKRAIIRAKERRGALYSRDKDHVKNKSKQMLTSIQEDPVRCETSSVGQQHMREKVTPESGNLGNKPAPNNTTAGIRVSSSSTSASIDRLKPEKIKGSSGSHGQDSRVIDSTLIKKKVKRNPELDMNKTCPGKPPTHGEERHRPPKQASGPSVESNLQLQPLSGVEQSS